MKSNGRWLHIYLQMFIARLQRRRRQTCQAYSTFPGDVSFLYHLEANLVPHIAAKNTPYDDVVPHLGITTQSEDLKDEGDRVTA